VNYAELSLLAARGADTPNRGALLAATPDGRVSVLRGSPAAAAGLRAGDIITAIDGEQLTAKYMLAEALASYAPGDTVAFTVQRGQAGASLEVSVTLGTAPAK
jgi:putative serine protease PepD